MFKHLPKLSISITLANLNLKSMKAHSDLVDNINKTVINKTVRVCVLAPSYEDSNSATKQWDSHRTCTPEYFFPKGFVDTKAVSYSDDGGEGVVVEATLNTSYTFEYIELKKATAYRDLRGLIKSGKYDVYFNLCDGAKDEDRAGEEVVRTLEEFNVPFTGAASKYYELSKPDMKMIAHYSNIPTARHAVLEAADLLPVQACKSKASSAAMTPTSISSDVPTTTDVPTDSNLTLRLEEKCRHLRFPVIVKHVSGYASIGMTKENKCMDMAALIARATKFIEEFDFALVEEFIVGEEATVFACADATVKGGIRVYTPVLINFPPGSDFKHFELKWQGTADTAWRALPENDPALEQIMSIGRRSFKEMMGGIGYGRCDLRINRERNEVVFLEINPNCGIMYGIGLEGSADHIIMTDGIKKQKEEQRADIDRLKGQRDFAMIQINDAIARCEKTKPLWYRSFDTTRDFHLRAAKNIKKGTVVFHDEGRAVRLFTKPFVDSHWSEEDKKVFDENAWPIGSGSGNGTSQQQPYHYFAVWDINPSNWRTFNHSEDSLANLIFAPNRSLNVIAARDIEKGEELTMNYESLKVENMPQPKRERSNSGHSTPTPTPTTI